MRCGGNDGAGSWRQLPAMQGVNGTVGLGIESIPGMQGDCAYFHIYEDTLSASTIYQFCTTRVPGSDRTSLVIYIR